MTQTEKKNEKRCSVQVKGTLNHQNSKLNTGAAEEKNM